MWKIHEGRGEHSAKPKQCKFSKAGGAGGAVKGPHDATGPRQEGTRAKSWMTI